jgi:hypothetical protein
MVVRQHVFLHFFFLPITLTKKQSSLANVNIFQAVCELSEEPTLRKEEQTVNLNFANLCNTTRHSRSVPHRQTDEAELLR